MYELAKIVWICTSEVVRISHLVKYVRIAVRSGWKYRKKCFNIILIINLLTINYCPGFIVRSLRDLFSKILDFFDHVLI